VAYLIDSSILIAWERQRLSGDQVLLAGEAKAISAITVAELFHGVHRAQGAHLRLQRERKVEAMLSALQILPYTEEVARLHAALWAQLAESGQVIGAHDLIIAATALSFDLTLVTLNIRHFERVPGLVLAPLR
jgi:tRNA(fMet)-specific endonuclease VapC